MSKILDGKIHAMNREWAYAGFEYDLECKYDFIFADIYRLLIVYSKYIKDKDLGTTMSDFSIIKYPAYEMDGEKHNAFLLMKFKRIAEDGLDE